MGTPTGDALREKARQEAQQRIADKPNMVRDGDAIEELAKAYERHAERLKSIAADLREVGRTNHLGDVVEGRAATHNIVVAVHDHPRSLVAALNRQADHARTCAEQLRRNNAAISQAEWDSVGAIRGTQPS